MRSGLSTSVLRASGCVAQIVNRARHDVSRGCDPAQGEIGEDADTVLSRAHLPVTFDPGRDHVDEVAS